MSAAAEPTTPLLVPCRSAKESSEPIVDHSRGDTRPHISPRDSISRIFAYCGFFVTSLVASSAFSTAIQSLSYPAVFGGHKSEVVTSAFYQFLLVFGQCIGCLFGGVACDICGRRASYIVSLGIMILVLLLNAVTLAIEYFSGVSPRGVPHQVLWLFMSALLGVSSTLLYPICGSILVESSPAVQRHVDMAKYMCTQGLAQLFGGLLVVGLLAAFDAETKGRAEFNSQALLLILFCVPIAILCLLFIAALMWLNDSTFYYEYRADLNLFMGMRTPTRPSFTRIRSHVRSCWKTGMEYPERLAGCAVPWLLFDITFYCDGVLGLISVADDESMTVPSALGNDPPAMFQDNMLSLMVVGLSLTGYFLGIKGVKKVPPKLMQLIGFVVLSFCFFGLALSLWSVENPESAVNDRVADCLLFNAFFRFFNFGPNITTYLIPLESWPTPIRGTMHGFAGAAAKLGATIGLGLFWILRSRKLMCVACAICAGLATLATMMYTPHLVPVSADLELIDGEWQKGRIRSNE
ncbi:sugar transporter, putative [Perkinsus marinus ATCC 50983]|uniref:Sugar transporter, putative n=1 Tax=Perkinsus marinus (strain ATCC 50983 / TXsc) TaxID=423536 RepID=C5LSL5_PERM5|nr:sugar transporter, putative [Perkinsus marinus ATCC 50983]EER00256.1 sugar transporter, putative [Perkinsus marinus ATCC 50983]|eukprot:XP_002767538.1 sugar transporter, putative [Perkinsus marinus ATCC 50983]